MHCQCICVHISRHLLLSNSSVAVGVVAINQAVDDSNLQDLVSTLQVRSTGICSVIPDCGEAYLTELKELKEEKKQRGKLLWEFIIKLCTVNVFTAMYLCSN